MGGAQRSSLEAAYGLYLLGHNTLTVTAPASLVPLVYSKKAGTTTPIVTPKCSLRPARLKTRTR
jgi:hypothetical protein